MDFESRPHQVSCPSLCLAPNLWPHFPVLTQSNLVNFTCEIFSPLMDTRPWLPLVVHHSSNGFGVLNWRVGYKNSLRYRACIRREQILLPNVFQSRRIITVGKITLIVPVRNEFTLSTRISYWCEEITPPIFHKSAARVSVSFD